MLYLSEYIDIYIVNIYFVLYFIIMLNTIVLILILPIEI